MQTAEAASTSQPPFLHRLIAAGNLRYWLILSWGLALATVVPFRTALLWFFVTLASGLARTVVERRPLPLSPKRLARLRLAIATLSCVAWGAAPLLAAFSGQPHGLMLALGLLMAGYTLVFTQMRAAPREALIVSAPYTLVAAIILIDLWGSPAFWVMLAMGPVVGLPLLIKVVFTQMKDNELEAVNHRQAELIVDLEAARDRADAASAAKSNFLGVISHELRTPMNGVLGAAELLRMGELHGRQGEFVEIIRSSGESLLVLLNDVLDMTKMEAGKLDLDPKPVSTRQIEDRLIGPFRAQAEAKGLAFDCQVVGTLPETLVIDLPRLAQITHNLLGNAVKFTQTGRVGFEISAEPAPDGADLVVRVSDSGIGIDAADIANLFEPFSQADNSSTRRFGGTGLGLSICRQLAELMDGEVSVESEPGRGSVFTFRAVVPVSAMAEAA